MKKVRAILYQKSLGISITNSDIEEMRAYKPDFICFPEYFFVDQNLGNHGQTPKNQKFQLKRIESLSRELNTVVIGGTMPELSDGVMYNTSFVFNRGKQLGFYRKKNLFFAEVGKITPGNEYKIFEVNGIKFGVIICADVFHDESFLAMKAGQAEIIFSPTFSPYKDETVEAKYERDKDIYVRGAALADAVIVKVCGVKSEYKPFLQARSLIADKNEILYRVQPEEEDKEMIIKKEVIIG